MPEEVRFFGRSAVFAVIIGVIYWFVSYEAAGTVLLLGFGLAGLVATMILARDARNAARRDAAAGGPVFSAGRPWTWIRLSAPDQVSPFPSEEGRAPGPSVAPLTVGAGFALIMLGLVFGPWLAVLGIIPLVFGGRLWLTEAMAEWRVVDGSSTEDRPPGD